jgi:hypothetical protein
MRSTHYSCGLLLALCASVASGAAENPTPPMPEAEEIQAALEAAPSHLREEAGVFVQGDTGYRRVRESTNGFNCLVAREIPAAFEPRCYDAEGSASLLPVLLFRAGQRARGVPTVDIDREVAARYTRGEYFAPRRTGVCYMLSMRNIVIVDRAIAHVGRVGPRLMFYAPNLRNEDLGATPDLEARFLVADEATQASMIIVPVVSARRARTFYYAPEALTPLSESGVSASADAAPVDSLGHLAEEDTMIIEQPKPPKIIDPFTF